MSFLDHLNESVINIEDLFETVEYALVEDLLDESVEHFKDLPNAWKKAFTRYDKFAGENSEIEIKSTGKIKNKTAFNKLLKDSLKDTADNAGVIIEVDDMPVLAIINNYDKRFNLIANDGNLKKITRSRWDRGTRHTSGRIHKWESGDFKVQESVDQITQTLVDLAIDKANAQIEDESKFLTSMSLDDVIASLNITVKVVSRDRQRIAKNVERNNDRNERNFGNKDSLAANRRAVIKKYTKENIASLVDDIKNSLPKIDDIEELLLKAAEGETVEFNVKDLQKRLDNLNYVLRRFTSAYKSGKIKSDWKNELDWDMKYLKDAIDRFHGKND